MARANLDLHCCANLGQLLPTFTAFALLTCTVTALLTLASATLAVLTFTIDALFAVALLNSSCSFAFHCRPCVIRQIMVAGSETLQRLGRLAGVLSGIAGR